MKCVSLFVSFGWDPMEPYYVPLVFNLVQYTSIFYLPEGRPPFLKMLLWLAKRLLKREYTDH